MKTAAVIFAILALLLAVPSYAKSTGHRKSHSYITPSHHNSTK